MPSAFFPSTKGPHIDRDSGCSSEIRSSHAGAPQNGQDTYGSFKFPASRRSLWDRTSHSPKIHLTSKDCLPKIKLDKASEWKKAHAGGVSSWDLACTSTEDTSPDFMFGTGHGDIKEALPLDTLTAGTAINDPVADLASHASSACPQTCPLSQVVRLRASVGAHNGQVLVKAAAPTATVSLLPLLPKRIRSTPLTDSLLSALQQSRRASLENQSFSCVSMQHGVLTLDQGRSLVPLHAAEDQAQGVPVVGVWVSGVRSVRDAHVWAACIRFLLSADLQDKALQPDMAFLVLVYAPGEGTYPACYEAKVGVDEQQRLPLATFSVRARPALQTGCASFSLDLATAGKAFIPIHTGCCRKVQVAPKTVGAASSAACAPQQLMERMWGDVREHSSEESEVPQPRRPFQKQPLSAGRRPPHHSWQGAADEECRNKCSTESSGSRALQAEVTLPERQNASLRPSPCQAGQGFSCQANSGLHAQAPIVLPDAAECSLQAHQMSYEGITWHSNPVVEERQQQHGPAAVTSPQNESSIEDGTLPLGALSSTRDEKASGSEVEGPATPGAAVPETLLTAPQQPLASPDTAMLQRQVDMLKEQLEELKLQLQVQGHGAALPAQTGPGHALSPLQSHQSATLAPGEVSDQHKLPNGAETGHPSIGSSACSPLRSTASTDSGSSGVGSPAAISRQSSFSAHSHADLAAAAATFAAYAQQPCTLDDVPHPAIPLKADAASTQPDTVDGVELGCACEESENDGKLRSDQCPELHPQPVLHAADVQEIVEVQPAVLEAQSGADQAGFAAEHRTAKRWRYTSSLAYSDSDEGEDPAELLVESAAAFLQHSAGNEVPHVRCPVRSAPYRHQHAIIRAVEPELDSLTDSEDEAEMARLERKYNIIPRSPSHGRPTSNSPGQPDELNRLSQCSFWPDASCHISI
ncbi:probable SCL-interrupting locus protein homolog at N-terminal half [Coccomyxa sp. Obi]|nr:probable SCL-interrupting locus protein homolog at N-terminal half [Coccomyxa sp. Obi]